MRGIILKDSIELFGFKSGFSHWFNWSFTDPIKMWYWLHISHKPYCLYRGYSCDKENCNYEHLLTKEEILDHWEESKKESKIIEVGENGMCIACGEEKATTIIDDPNFDSLKKWKVCVTCSKIIPEQHKLSFGAILSEKEHGKEIGNQMMGEASQKINDLAYESNKEVTSITFIKDEVNEHV